MSSLSSAFSALKGTLKDGSNPENKQQYLRKLERALNEYVTYIKDYKNNKAIIYKIIELLESFPGISSPPPISDLPKFTINGIDGIYSFVSATIRSIDDDDKLLQLYLLKLLYFKFKVPTKNTPSSERESRNKDYTNTPSVNIVCINEFWLLYDIYERYKASNILTDEMFVVFYKKLFPPTKS